MDTTPSDRPQDGQASNDEEALVPELSLSGSTQIILIGLLVFVALYFGADLLDLIN